MVPWIESQATCACVRARACHTLCVCAYARILRRGWPTGEKSLNFRASGQRGKNERSRKEGGYLSPSIFRSSPSLLRACFLLRARFFFILLLFSLCSSMVNSMCAERERERCRQREETSRTTTRVHRDSISHIYVYIYNIGASDEIL